MKIKKVKLYLFFVVTAFLALIFAQIILTVSQGKDRQNLAEKRRAYIDSQQVILSTEERDTLALINEYRNENGLKSLKPCNELQEVAKLKAEDLVNNDYFAHDSDILGSPFEMLKANSVEYKIAGENLAGNTTPERAVEAWIDSKLHRDNILEEKYEYTGIYIIDSDVYGKIYVQLFMGV